jgi:hypothetical protein
VKKYYLLTIIILASALCLDCRQRPPDNAVEMEIIQTTRVVYHIGQIKPVFVGVKDEGDTVRAHPTSEGWYKIWWQQKGIWKTGYVDSSCVRPLRNQPGE